MASPTLAELIAKAQAFRADDPDPETRAEIDQLLARPDPSELRERFGSRLDFGTAGLRGLRGAGDNRMNRRVVAQTTAGLCEHLATTFAGARERGLCVGFDARHGSRAFAEEVIAIACAAGFVVHAFEAPGPTPLLAFAVLARGAAAGVMITASHNPAAYNGYKVYLDDGAQLRQPHDAAIARAIAAIGPVLALPRLAPPAARAAGLLRDLPSLEHTYRTRLLSQLSPHADLSRLCVAYSALHGVGGRLACSVLQALGVGALHSVTTQAEPDPDFPSLRFPNPEEPGALDQLLALAEHEGAELALANDPDADRLAVAARAADGRLAVLSGNEVGVLLADYLLERAPRDGRNLVVSSIVSTPLVHRVARAHGARSETTLTGFKWIVPRGLQLVEREGLRFVLGFEEALGYCIGSLVHDKDGIAAAAQLACMTADYARRGSSLVGALESLYRRHGLFESRQRSILLPGQDGLAQMQQCLRGLRQRPPRALGPHRIVRSVDLETGVIVQGGQRSPATLPKSNVLSFELEAGHRLTVRPSGTEPKLKIYVDSYAALAVDEPLAAGRARARAEADALLSAFTATAGLCAQ